MPPMNDVLQKPCEADAVETYNSSLYNNTVGFDRPQIMVFRRCSLLVLEMMAGLTFVQSLEQSYCLRKVYIYLGSHWHGFC